MSEPYTQAEIAAAFERLTAEQSQHQHQAQDTWDFWGRALPRPWPKGVAEELASREGRAADPVDLADLDMATFIENRERLGIKDSNGILGAEVQSWQRTRPTTEGRSR